jgi:hypothetical protein
MQITIYGASDDLIEIEGDIREEFSLDNMDDNGDLLAFSDGTVLRIAYKSSGVWRITKVFEGTATIEINQAPEADEDNYSDRATVTGDPLVWVVHGIDFKRAA